jgi:hypothetical protein
MPEKILGIPWIPSVFVEAKPTPRHNGKATKKTTRLAGKSDRQLENNFFIKYKL